MVAMSIAEDVAVTADRPRKDMNRPCADDGLRHDWTTDDIIALFELPFNDLMFRAQTEHRRHFDANRVQMSRLLSIKTGGCPEDCKYCPQSAHFDTGVDAGKLMAVQAVLEEAKRAKALAEHAADVHRRTGLVLSPHYGATKLAWCLDELPAVRAALAAGTLAFGPQASFLALR